MSTTTRHEPVQITRAVWDSLPRHKKRTHRGRRQVLRVNLKTMRAYWETVTWKE